MNEARAVSRALVFVGLMAAIPSLTTACSSSAATLAPAVSGAPTPVQPSLAASPSAAPSETAAPATAEPSATAGAATTASPERHSDTELEAALPDVYHGVTLQKVSRKLSDVSGTSNDRNRAFEALIESLGKTTADASLAVALDPSARISAVFYAYRINGVAATVWWPRYRKIIANDTPSTTLTDVTLGGRTVTHVVSPTGKPILYMWARRDLLYLVTTGTEAEAGDAIAAVP